MRRKRSFIRWLVLACGGLIVLLIVLAAGGYVLFRVFSVKRAQSALERVKASGAPTTWKEVVPPPVPDDENAALMYQKAIAALVLPDLARQAISDYAFAGSREDRKRHEAAAREALAHNAEALSFARKAAERPKCRFNRDWQDPIAIEFPEHAKLKNLSLLASAQAVLRTDGGDMAGAFRAWSLNLGIAKHVGADPMLLGQLSGYTVLGQGAMSLRRLLEDGRPSVEQCRAAAQALEKVDLQGPFLKCLEAQRAADLWVLERVRSDPGYLAQFMGVGPPAQPGQGPSRGTTLGSLALNLIGPLDQAATLRVWEKQIALARKPYREASAELSAVENTIPDYALLTRLMFPVYGGRLSMPRDKALATVALMRIGLGLAAHRAKYAKYPASLGELRATLKWATPEDPFSGKDFVYRREGAGYRLYSIGFDLEDDGGVPVRDNRIEDIVWWLKR